MKPTTEFMESVLESYKIYSEGLKGFRKESPKEAMKSSVSCANFEFGMNFSVEEVVSEILNISELTEA
jgi:hypothetical protein